jgi:hypothetical protein
MTTHHKLLYNKLSRLSLVQPSLVTVWWQRPVAYISLLPGSQTIPVLSYRLSQQQLTTPEMQQLTTPAYNILA